MVGPLAAACADDDWLTRTATVAGDVLNEVISWVAASLQAHTLADELAESTDRMSELVRAVKSYAFMDRGEVVQADVHEGIVTTLMVLKHKWKHQSIELDKSFDKTLPRITMYGSELNQVWTNLIDNAIDAIGESGTISITTRREGECIVVDIGDTGPGMPPEVKRRIFDPFFTTKEVGSGTGLGLDVARRIVVNRHGGSINVDSEPGRTVFHVWLPIAHRRRRRGSPRAERARGPPPGGSGGTRARVEAEAVPLMRARRRSYRRRLAQTPLSSPCSPPPSRCRPPATRSRRDSR